MAEAGVDEVVGQVEQVDGVLQLDAESPTAIREHLGLDFKLILCEKMSTDSLRKEEKAVY